MSKRVKLNSLTFVSALIVAIAMPLTAHAGSLTIYNKNCTKTANFTTKKRITLHVYPQDHRDEVGCTNEWITVHKGSSRTIEISKYSMGGLDCGKYRHEAAGTAFGHFDVDAGKDSHVTCKKDRLGVCQCTKD